MASIAARGPAERERQMTTRREVIAAGLAAGALPLIAGRGFAAGIETGAGGGVLVRRAEGDGAEPGGRALRAAGGGGGRAPREHRLRPAQPDQLPRGGDALGRRAGRGEGAVLPSGALLQGAGRDQRRRGRHGAGDPVHHRALRHARRASGAAADARGLRRLPGDGPGRGERLDGGARRLLLAHLRLLGAVRALDPRARDRSGRAGAGGVPAVLAVLARARRGRRDRHLRAAREPAGDRGLPDRQQPRAGARHLPGRRLQPLPARRRRAARDRAADLDVLVRQEQPLDRAGLAARDPRQRRAGDGARLGRADLAAA